jgi:cellulose synthase/poly-beta-1,6-N-acetylglucosamine synthase-like glycosyltransferase
MVMARGEIIVFTDARQTLTPHALDALLSNFADESVTAVAGTLVCATDGPEGIFRRYEEALRGWEAAWGSPAGASGALYAVRREAVVSLHHGTILDDLVISLSAAGAGRMTWERSAVACEAAEGHGRIWRRRIRTLAGNWQLLLHPVRYRSVWSHETFVQFFCHKVLRLVFPLFAAGFAVCMGMSAPGAVLPVTVAVMFLFAAGALASKRAARAVLQTFGSLVLAPLGGLAHYLLGRESVLWARR